MNYKIAAEKCMQTVVKAVADARADERNKVLDEAVAAIRPTIEQIKNDLINSAKILERHDMLQSASEFRKTVHELDNTIKAIEALKHE